MTSPLAGLAVITLATLTALLVVAVGYALARWGVGRRLTSDADRARFDTLHLTALAAPSLRQGLTAGGARPAARHLRALLGTPSLALVSATELLAWEGADDAGGAHADAAVDHAGRAVRESRTRVLGPREVACGRPGCPLRGAVVSVLGVEDRVIGAVVAYSRERPTAQLVRATEEVARWVASQVELAELDAQRSRTAEAELRALRAQISPHFVYNCLAAIAVFVRTDPDRARELLLDFADFTRYAFRREAAFTTLADELRNVERYLVLEQARFGDRLVVDLTVSQEVLAVAVPFLSVQPLVENAVRHGLESGRATVRVVVRAEDDGDAATISGGRRRCRRRPRGGAGRRRGPGVARLDRPGQRRPAAAAGVRRLGRPGGRDRPRRGDPGVVPGAEVRGRGAAGLSAVHRSGPSPGRR